MKTSMCIGKRLGLILAYLLSWGAFATRYAAAHPVAQGTLEYRRFSRTHQRDCDGLDGGGARGRGLWRAETRVGT